VASSFSLAALQHVRNVFVKCDINESKPFPAPSADRVSKNLVLTAVSSTTVCVSVSALQLSWM
jgi:hypothetical protein